MNNQLARVPVTLNQQKTHETRGEVPSSAGAQHTDTTGYQVSGLGDVDFYWENDQLDVGAVFRPGIDTPFPPTTIDGLEIGLAENPILLDKEGKEKSPPTTPVSEKPTRSPALL